MRDEVFTCEICGRTYSSGQRQIFGDQELCSDCFQQETLLCSVCGARIWADENAGSDGTPLCQRCYEREYTNCIRCGALLHNDSAYYSRDDEDDEEPLCYGHSLTQKQRNHILTVLSVSCEARGTDATGIAYHSHGKLCIYKRPLPAHQMRFHVPADVWTIMGHTRLTTQGSEQRNYNNHPFRGTVSDGMFALAHNGVIRNDKLLRRKLGLPAAKIETDSYIGVQLLEQAHTLSFESLRRMAEQLEGSFTFTVLSGADDLYLVKGDNPMCLYHFPNRGLFLYASTEEILRRAIGRLRFRLGEATEIATRCGDILRITAAGQLTRGQFDSSRLLSAWFDPHWRRFRTPREPRPTKAATGYLDELKSVAYAFGYAPEEIDMLAAEGFSPEELEEFLYCGEL